MGFERGKRRLAEMARAFLIFVFGGCVFVYSGKRNRPAELVAAAAGLSA